MEGDYSPESNVMNVNCLEVSKTEGFSFANGDHWLRDEFCWHYFDPHALYLFICWNFLSIFMVGVNRWMGHWWKSYIYIHAVIGIILLFFTCYLGKRAWVRVRHDISNPSYWAHSIPGIIMTLLTFFIALTGVIARYFVIN